MSIRSHSRQITVQCLFQWSFNPKDIQVLIEDHIGSKKEQSVDREYLNRCLTGCIEHLEKIDQIIEACSKRETSSISPMELAILRLGVFELLYLHDIPYKVTITECLELSHKFGGTESHKFINHILDMVAKNDNQ